MQVLIFCELGLKTPVGLYASLNWSFRGKIGTGLCDVDPKELVLTFGGCYRCATLAKIDQKCDRESANRQTDGHKQGQTQTEL